MARWLTAVVVCLGGLLGTTGVARAETITYYYTNQQGTPLATADAAGNVLSTADYRPYGVQALGTPEAGPGYTGHVDDPGSGLVYMQARYYDPSVGRFISVDPKGIDTGRVTEFTRFAYAGSNPVGNVDPDGRRTTVVDGQVFIQPEDHRFPSFPIPNSVNATGFSPGVFFHEYATAIPVPLTLAQAGDGLTRNPTPGHDRPASPGGTINNVGALPLLGENNFVGSFLVQSPNPTTMSNIVVNYTLAGAHGLAEGFVMRFAEKQPNGSVVIQNYGEGNAIPQSFLTGPIPLMFEEAAWRQNVKEIVDGAH